METDCTYVFFLQMCSQIYSSAWGGGGGERYRDKRDLKYIVNAIQDDSGVNGSSLAR